MNSHVSSIKGNYTLIVNNNKECRLKISVLLIYINNNDV